MMTKEIFVTIPIVLYTQKDFYLLNAINTQIMNLKAAGFIDFWHKQDIDKRKSNVKKSKQPKVLTMNQLLGCFQLMFGGCVMSFIVFLTELVSLKLSFGLKLKKSIKF